MVSLREQSIVYGNGFPKGVTKYMFIEDTLGNLDACEAYISIETNIPNFYFVVAEDYYDLMGHETPQKVFEMMLSHYPEGVRFKATFDYGLDKQIWEARYTGTKGKNYNLECTFTTMPEA